MAIIARTISSRGPDRVMGIVEEKVWTTVLHEIDDAPVPGAIGQRTLVREVYLAFKAEAEAWADAQRAEGFTVRPLILAATNYFGPTDSPSNCWLVQAEKPAPDWPVDHEEGE